MYVHILYKVLVWGVIHVLNVVIKTAHTSMMYCVRKRERVWNAHVHMPAATTKYGHSKNMMAATLSPDTRKDLNSLQKAAANNCSNINRPIRISEVPPYINSYFLAREERKEEKARHGKRERERKVQWK